MCGIDIVGVVYLSQFLGSHDTKGILDSSIQEFYGFFSFHNQVGPV